eukprot:9130548-Lingulodinium_polyedra.AAC.1
MAWHCARGKRFASQRAKTLTSMAPLSDRMLMFRAKNLRAHFSPDGNTTARIFFARHMLI